LSQQQQQQQRQPTLQRYHTPGMCQMQNVEHQFTGVAQDPRSTFIGNVKVGRDIQLAELQSLYSGVSTALGL
jgi:adrenodoxin-NADP+ reductase